MLYRCSARWACRYNHLPASLSGAAGNRKGRGHPRSTRVSDTRILTVNLPTAGVDYHVPFGGTRKSSYGPREQSVAAIELYTLTKTSYSLD
jgi:acyl-CoA reductase-like NAD-dependent aldehyde dehydrogenase